MRTSIYVDGFNLYFGALRKTSYKWLDIMALCKNILKPEHEITKIKYFTANVSSTVGDPNKPIDQQLYLRALTHSTPEIEIIKGQFATHQVTRRLVTPIEGQRFAKVLDTKEKGSDVNLAVHLVNDAWMDKYDCAVVISGDSDLAEAIRVVLTHHTEKTVGVFSPTKKCMSRELEKISTFTRAIPRTALANSQLPDLIPDTNISKPKDW